MTAGRTIVVVDDNTSTCSFAAAVLGSIGFTVLAPYPAAKALATIRSAGRPIDLVMADIVNPGPNGWDLASELERSHPSVKLLYLTGNRGSIAADILAERAPESVLRKPFTAEALVSSVMRILAGPSRDRA